MKSKIIGDWKSEQYAISYKDTTEEAYSTTEKAPVLNIINGDTVKDIIHLSLNKKGKFVWIFKQSIIGLEVTTTGTYIIEDYGEEIVFNSKKEKIVEPKYRVDFKYSDAPSQPMTFGKQIIQLDEHTLILNDEGAEDILKLIFRRQ